MTVAEGKNVGAAIGLVCLAGAASSIGASVVFFPSLVKRTSRRVLASALGLSAGVMIYLSFLEVAIKSKEGFVSAGVEDEGTAYVYATLSFFGGVATMIILEFAVKRLGREPPDVHRDEDEDIEVVWNEDQAAVENDYDLVPAQYCIGCNMDPVGDLRAWHEKAELELQGQGAQQEPPIMEMQEVPPKDVPQDFSPEKIEKKHAPSRTNRRCSSTVASTFVASFTVSGTVNGTLNGYEERAEIPINEISFNEGRQQAPSTANRRGSCPSTAGEVQEVPSEEVSHDVSPKEIEKKQAPSRINRRCSSTLASPFASFAVPVNGAVNRDEEMAEIPINEISFNEGRLQVPPTSNRRGSLSSITGNRRGSYTSTGNRRGSCVSTLAGSFTWDRHKADIPINEISIGDTCQTQRVTNRRCSSSALDASFTVEQKEEEKAEITTQDDIVTSVDQQEPPQERGGTESTEGEGKPIVVVLETVPRSQDEEDGFCRPPARTRIHPEEQKRKLIKMSLNTDLAIGLHNFPEGLATFLAALDDPSVGAILACAIGLHNIPEGLCVALPIYYATGNRWKAFMWGCLSGLTEPIAAILGWLILATVINDVVYAILFGLVGGMMMMISLRELMPTAHRYDPEDTVVTYSILTGMGVMGLSLVLFNLS